MHIEKTAGHAFRVLLERVYDGHVLLGMNDEERNFLRTVARTNPDVAASARVVHGHMPWGFHRWFPCAYTYVAFVRKPLDRVVSYYHYCRGSTTHNLRGVANELDLEGFVKLNPFFAVDNAMCRYFAGRIGSMAVRSCDLPRGATLRQLLEEAQENIERDFPVVGIVERMDASLRALEARYGWSPGQRAMVVNANPGRPRIEDIPGSTRAMIEDANRLDVDLYDWCDRRLPRDVVLPLTTLASRG